jgi:protein-L-isoaspartate(D-aspartate) O-methyltransferase
MPNQTMRTNMLKQQLRTGNVLDPNILALYEEIPREAFVPQAFQAFAYSDTPIPLAYAQAMLTPLEEATILQHLALTGKETVLEIGTGTGFFTALLSRLSKEVLSIDYFSEFTKEASRKLASLQCNNVELITGDAYHGWIERAPYDVIVFTGGVETLSKTHLLQVAPNGSLVALVGQAPVLHAEILRFDATGNQSTTWLFETNTPLLIDKYKTPSFVF